MALLAGDFVEFETDILIHLVVFRLADAFLQKAVLENSPKLLPANSGRHVGIFNFPKDIKCTENKVVAKRLLNFIAVADLPAERHFLLEVSFDCVEIFPTDTRSIRFRKIVQCPVYNADNADVLIQLQQGDNVGAALRVKLPVVTVDEICRKHGTM